MRVAWLGDTVDRLLDAQPLAGKNDGRRLWQIMEAAGVAEPRAALETAISAATAEPAAQATTCAGCGKHKPTPLRIDAMGGYVCLTCIDEKLSSLLGEFGYPDAQPHSPDAADSGRVDEEAERAAYGRWFAGEQGKCYDGGWVFGRAAWLARAALAAQGQGEAVARLQGVIERDRTVFCGLIAGLKRELQTREWLGNENARAAGGYRYDEPGFIREFGEAWAAIMSALNSAHQKFRDFTDCPRGDAVRAAQAEAHAILDAPPTSPAGVPDGWKLAMFVLQSGMYHQLPEEERAVCDALVGENPHIAAPSSGASHG